MSREAHATEDSNVICFRLDAPLRMHQHCGGL